MGSFIFIALITAITNVLVLHIGAIILVKSGIIKLEGAPDWLAPWNLNKVKKIALSKPKEENILISFSDGKGNHEQILTLARELLEFRNYELNKDMKLMNELRENEETTSGMELTPIFVTLNGKKSVAA